MSDGEGEETAGFSRMREIRTKRQALELSRRMREGTRRVLREMADKQPQAEVVTEDGGEKEERVETTQPGYKGMARVRQIRRAG